MRYLPHTPEDIQEMLQVVGVGRLENLFSLDQFIAAMQAIAREAVEDPEKLRQAPHTPKVNRLDETAGAHNPCLRG